MEKIPLAAMGIFSGVYIKTRLINVPKHQALKNPTSFENQNFQKPQRSQKNEENLKKVNDFRLQQSPNFQSKEYHFDSHSESEIASGCYYVESVHSNSNPGGYYVDYLLQAEVHNGGFYGQEENFNSPYAEVIYSEPYKK